MIKENKEYKLSVKDKADILKKVSEKLDIVIYGKITIELRGPNRPIDVLLEHRERIFTDRKE